MARILKEKNRERKKLVFKRLIDLERTFKWLAAQAGITDRMLDYALLGEYDTSARVKEIIARETGLPYEDLWGKKDKKAA